MQYLKTTPHIKRVLNTRKKEFGIQQFDPPYAFNTASYWDGDSISRYSVLCLFTGEYTHPPTGSYPAFKAKYELPVGYVLIESGTFQGKPSTVRVMYYTADKPQVEQWLGITL
jgi:hypothetical protein